MIKNLLSHRVLGLALALALLAGSLAFIAPQGAEAALTNEIVTTYYSDASQTDVVGERIRNCWGTFDFWGSTSKYYTVTSIPCDLP